MRDRERELGVGPQTAAARIHKVGGSTQSIPNQTETYITFNVLERRQGGRDFLVRIGTPNSFPNVDGFTIVQAGFYLVSGCVHFDQNTAGRRQLVLYDGSERLTLTDTHAGANSDALAVSCVAFMPVGRHVCLTLWQNTGAALNVIQTGNKATHLAIARIG